MQSPNLFEQFLAENFNEFLRGELTIPPIDGEFIDLPNTLHPNIKKTLEDSSYKKLYSHQAEAFESISKNIDTLLLSRTASGKTFSFMLPILNEYNIAKNSFSVLFLYPTKALSRDQESTLGKLLQVSTLGKYGTYDGDTVREERDNLVKYADFIITNPDMLHSGILPNHNRKWRSFLSRLRYIVVDEVHTYRGAFGSHVSNVFRRLLRICNIHGSNPTFVCCSATIGNPAEHAKALFHREFKVIDKDGSPRAEKKIHFLNPALVKGAGEAIYRKGTKSLSIPIIRFATRNNIRTICFCRARQEVERLYHAVIEGNWDIKDKIKPYRGGLLPSERRRIEKDMFSGELNTIITTNALELGIDIGDMTLCILSGHPGSVSSFWQQAGRVGRSGKKSNIIFIAKDSSIDQYIIHHNDFITNASWEEAWLSAENPYIILQHLPCAAYEYPLGREERLFQNEVYPMAIETLLSNETLKTYRDVYRYALDEYPSKGVNLRGMTDYNIGIIFNGKVIGEIDPIGAMGTLYKDAIYQHIGKKFMSLDLDLEKKICEVEEVRVDYFTEAVWESMVNITEKEESIDLHSAIIDFGYMHVSKQTKLYKKIKEKSLENIGFGPITLPPFQYDTMGFCLTLPVVWVKKISLLNLRYPDIAVIGISYLLKNSATSICMGDPSDIHTDVALSESIQGEWKSSLYLYDAIEGGAGFSEKIFHRISDALNLSIKILDECECDYGCPACVPPSPPGIRDTDLELFLVQSNATVETTRSLLHFLLTGEYLEPEIKNNQSSVPRIKNEPVDPEKQRMFNRFVRSAEILKSKRERLH